MFTIIIEFICVLLTIQYSTALRRVSGVYRNTTPLSCTSGARCVSSALPSLSESLRLLWLSSLLRALFSICR